MTLSFFAPLAAAATEVVVESPETHNPLEHLAGFALVLVTLSLLWAITHVIGKYFKLQNALEAAQAAEKKAKDAQAAAEKMLGQGRSAPAAASASASAASATGRLAPELVAVIAAAVAAAIQQPHRVLQIRPQGSQWGQEGRRAIFSSHRIR